MREIANHQPTNPAELSPINAELLSSFLEQLPTAELDALDAELTTFDKTGKASDRINRILNVLDAQEQRRRSKSL